MEGGESSMKKAYLPKKRILLFHLIEMSLKKVETSRSISMGTEKVNEKCVSNSKQEKFVKGKCNVSPKKE